MKKVLVVCGNGLGSSFIIEMNVKKILTELGMQAEVSHTDLASSKSEQADLYLGAKDIICNLRWYSHSCWINKHSRFK